MSLPPPGRTPPLAVPGFRVGTASCGVQAPELKGKRQDVTLIVADLPCHAAGVFTQNRFRAPCVDLGRETLDRHGGEIRCIVANAGNANAGLGERGRIWARRLIEAGARAAGCAPEQTLSASTGVIGEPFPIERIEAGMGEASATLRPDGWADAADAIRTTDTFAKWASATVDGYTITGIAKGSGMIHPEMATMLAFIATDAPLSHAQLKPMLVHAVDRSFNAISVDGDTSTNDTVYLLASGLGLGHAPREEYPAFAQALTRVCIELAKLIVRDGEGVSRFVTIEVTGARSEAEARTVGRRIAVSPLVKTALAGGDANWGRILCAIGNAGVEIDRGRLALSADGVAIVDNGELHPDYTDAAGMAVFARDAFTIRVDLGMGEASATVWTGDLTHDYITINAEYRS
ncbi:MAG: bifunctional glutamate N-acetyltransferase/amino-acid acetyltransferase ArgJ [Zetaproteobacteria bacterium]|nr:MAG: bifunctional glutamate N-acetyltransferase/amino-acid acetyltransferase ArgJ [Zetaproteobacteria bacterium]